MIEKNISHNKVSKIIKIKFLKYNVMKLFWKFNLFASLSTLILFITYIISAMFCFINYDVCNFIASITWLFFVYGVFLEIIQIPICIFGLFFNNRPKKVWLFFLMMITFAIIKISLYINFLVIEL